MNTCHFCGPTDAELTKEELWPKWYSRFLYELGVRSYATTRILSNQRKTSWRPLTIDSSIYGVCKPCNNNTLSPLENGSFKPLLKRTLKPPINLSIDDQAIFVAWIARFVFVADLIYAGDRAPFFTATERKTFIDTFLPPDDVFIWLASIKSTFPAGCAFSRLFFTDKSTGTVCTGIVGLVAFQFLLRRWIEPHPSDAAIAKGMRPTIEGFASATVQIFPSIAGNVIWPPPAHFENDSFKSFSNRWGGNSPGPS